MDPVSALSAAANVVQFVDFSSKLLSQAAEFRQTPLRSLYSLVAPVRTGVLDDVLARIMELEAVTDYLLPIGTAGGNLGDHDMGIAAYVDELRGLLFEVIEGRQVALWRSPIMFLETTNKLARLQRKLSDLNRYVQQDL